LVTLGIGGEQYKEKKEENNVKGCIDRKKKKIQG